MSRYLAERFVTLQEPIQGTQLVERPGRQRPARMLSNEASEPLAQRTSLICNFVQFTRHRSRFQPIKCCRWNKLRRGQPLQQANAAVEQVNRCIDRCRDGIQEIEAERVGNENCRRSALHDRPPKQATSSNRITSITSLDKLCDGFHNLSNTTEQVMNRRPRDLRSNRMAMKDVSVVLAHGAWADGSSWGRVITALKAEAVKVLAAPLPLTSLADDVAALNRSLDRTEGPIVLAGHAYAGAVIALARPERVKALVYVTALAPDEGEKVADVFYRLEPHPQAPKLAPDNNGLIWLPKGAFATAFAQNASAEDCAVLAAVERPISLSCITLPVGRPLWKDIPSWFLVAEEDRMIVPETQRYMAERMKAKIGALTVDHAPSVTAPTVVVDVIREAIRSVTGS